MESTLGHHQAGAGCRLEEAANGPGGEPGGGDPRAFAASLPAVRRELYRWARFLSQDHAAADDLVQAALECAWLARDRFPPGNNLVAWLKSIIRNRFIDDRRHAAVCQRWLEMDESPAPEPLGPLDVLGLDDVVAAMGRLGNAERELIELAYFKRISHREISAQLGAPMSTTGTRLFRAKAKLRRTLQEVYDDRRARPRPSVHETAPPPPPDPP